jgi:RNA polymerase sigma factor (TIGR02999 family)
VSPTTSLPGPSGELGYAAYSESAEAGVLFATLYQELRAIAERQLHRGRSDMTLGTTTLLHEAYLKLASRPASQFENQAHFLAYAARAMRRLTIDYARQRRAKKRGGEFHITSSGADQVADAIPAESLENLSAALETLARAEPELAHLVDLHFFCGFSLVEVAALLGVSDRTVQRNWRKARLLLHRAMQDS